MCVWISVRMCTSTYNSCLEVVPRSKPLVPSTFREPHNQQSFPTNSGFAEHWRWNLTQIYACITEIPECRRAISGAPPNLETYRAIKSMMYNSVQTKPCTSTSFTTHPITLLNSGAISPLAPNEWCPVMPARSHSCPEALQHAPKATLSCLTLLMFFQAMAWPMTF